MVLVPKARLVVAAVAFPSTQALYFAVDVATNRATWVDTSTWWTPGYGQWNYVAPVLREPALSPRAVAQINLARARRWEVVLEPAALRHRAPRLTVSPRTTRAGRQPVSACVRHVRQTRRR